MTDDITVSILKDIRDELRATRSELRAEIASAREELSERVEAVERRVGGVEQRQTESELRLASELVAVVGAIHEVRDVLKETLALAPRVHDHELRIRALESTAPRQE